MKKPTLATLKAFVRKNHSNIMIRCDSSFDGMTDCVEHARNPQFRPIKPYDDIHKVFTSNKLHENTLGISGVWLVGSSGDRIREYSQDGMFGYEVYNCCGSFVLALDLAACDAKANAIIASAFASVAAREAA